MPMGSISRRLPQVKTLDGSKSHHQVLDIGRPGHVLWREIPCHVCPGCMACDHVRIMNDCKYNDLCGKAEIVELTLSSTPTLVMTRARAEQAAKDLSNDAVVGDMLAWEMASVEVPFMLGFVEGTVAVHEGAAVGDVSPGDRVLRMRQWLPLQNGGGSASYYRSDVLLVKECDVRFHCSRPMRQTKHTSCTSPVSSRSATRTTRWSPVR